MFWQSKQQAAAEELLDDQVEEGGSEPGRYQTFTRAYH